MGTEGDQFTFRKNDVIGAAAAEEDDTFLNECFVDNGDLRALLDCANPKRIVVGRTGAGKSALLATISRERENVIAVSPHSLSLNFIANNSVIQFFEQAGVNLAPFYALLWKHVLVVELLCAKYKIRNDETQRQIMGRLRDMFYRKDRAKDMAFDYLESWGSKFWITVDEKLKEITTTFERRLSGSLEGGPIAAKLKAEGSQDLTREERAEVQERGRKVVSEVQIRELESMITILGEDVFSDDQERYYVTIDTLDEEWVDDRIKFHLIKALVDAIRSFRKVPNVKIVAALRRDLLQKVMLSAPSAGFQEEKYESLYLEIRWSRETLAQVIERRLNELVRRRYSARPVALSELLPANIDGAPAIEYLLDRTLMRPRDAILFVNECIAAAEGRPKFTAAVIKQAEEVYSAKRLQSLVTEWRTLLPNLHAVVRMLSGMKSHFIVGDVTPEWLEERYEAIVSHVDCRASDPITQALDSLFTPKGNFGTVRNAFLRYIHQIGLVGIRIGPTSTVSWALDAATVSIPVDIRPTAGVYIHPMFHRALEIKY